MDKDITKLLKAQNSHVKELQEIVKKTIEEENLIVQNLRNPAKEMLTRGQRVSDKVARFGGSWLFIISFLIILTVWIVYNVTVPKGKEFDPYPFILMNLILSCIAALQAPIIMMSQNRQEEKDRKRNENDYMINLKSELEVNALNQKIDLLLQKQIKELVDSQARQLEILKMLEQKLANK
ncbi:MAG: DUF1003 domain-containing protein [Chitinophagaceae bacterium]|nr:DUF1003 domain-containing protein [Chitinophagaceae bacterium]HQU57005.1 DUF1003 domain-containing protein [Chitinophagaceae bacterium]